MRKFLMWASLLCNLSFISMFFYALVDFGAIWTLNWLTSALWNSFVLKLQIQFAQIGRGLFNKPPLCAEITTLVNIYLKLNLLILRSIAFRYTVSNGIASCTGKAATPVSSEVRVAVHLKSGELANVVQIGYLNGHMPSSNPHRA